jgi:alpha-L-rhamnosidase
MPEPIPARLGRRVPGFNRVFVAALFVLAVLAAAAPPGARAEAGLGVADLRTEYAHDPLGIDVARPRLSWKLESEQRGRAQTAANGAGTMWESWDLGARSRSHFFLGMTEGWFFADLAGITAAAPGYRQITIRPQPGGGLDTARASHDSVYGEVESAWEDEGDTFRLQATIPVNTTATVYVPAKDASSVTGGGRPGERAPGVRFLRVDDGYAVSAVEAGRYRFASVT